MKITRAKIKDPDQIPSGTQSNKEIKTIQISIKVNRVEPRKIKVGKVKRWQIKMHSNFNLILNWNLMNQKVLKNRNINFIKTKIDKSQI